MRTSLMRRLAGRYRPGDRGAVAAIVALLLAGGVLIGMGAMVVDVGQLYYERQDLVKSSDTAAMAVAKACASAGDACLTMTRTVLDQLATTAADGSADLGAPQAQVVCGRVGGSPLGDCPPEPANLTGCARPRPADTGLNWVEVRTSTHFADGRTVLPPVFAQTVLGPKYRGTTVGACSRVAWTPTVTSAPPSQNPPGDPGGGDDPTTFPAVFPLMISQCALQKALAKGNVYAPAPTAGWTDGGAAVSNLYGSAARSGCTAADPRGSLALLTDPSTNTCFHSLTTGGTVSAMPATALFDASEFLVVLLTALEGATNNFGCEIGAFLRWVISLFSTAVTGLSHPPLVYLPVYSSVQTTCKPTWIPFLSRFFCTYSYPIVGFAAFEPTGGAFLPVLYLGDFDPPDQACFDQAALKGQNDDIPCLAGFFVKEQVTGGGGGAGPPDGESPAPTPSPTSPVDTGTTQFQQIG